MISKRSIHEETSSAAHARHAREMLSRAASVAQMEAKEDGCVKVTVASLLECTRPEAVVLGRNHVFGHNCAKEGCNRIRLYGEDSCNHRLPSDCMSIHSEVDAIANAARNGYSTKGATIYVTRYPCEACARAIIQAGISTVVYGRTQEISELTRKMFEDAGVDVYWYSDYIEEDVIEVRQPKEEKCGNCAHFCNLRDSYNVGLCSYHHIYKDKNDKCDIGTYEERV